MKIFTLEMKDGEAARPPSVVDPSGEPQSAITDWIKYKLRPVDRDIPTEEIGINLHKAISEAGTWFSTKIEGMPDNVRIDTVEVELGITLGGEVGLFAKGRADIAASFTVTLKVGEGQKIVNQ